MIASNFNWSYSPLCCAAANIVLSSTAGAAEYQGARLGEFVKAGVHKGRPYYRQRDTEGNAETYLYSEGGYWLVSDTLGNSSGWLFNNKNSFLPPTDGSWLFSKLGQVTADSSLTLEFTTFSPSCQEVRVSGKGAVVEDQGSKLGDYRSTNINSLETMKSQLCSIIQRYSEKLNKLFNRLEEGMWSEGRPVFKKTDGRKPQFLLIKEGEFFWSIRASTTATGIGIHGGKGTNSPGSPQAGCSAWLGLNGWVFVNDRGKWREGELSVTCL